MLGMPVAEGSLCASRRGGETPSTPIGSAHTSRATAPILKHALIHRVPIFFRSIWIFTEGAEGLLLSRPCFVQ